ncbi:MAG: type II toxin-antitoxin system VapC family toxin [SAR324 cluster bacterium]|nr:type II toxin-antitoxin system VapC family toxin [SAR324 cluster bacterium]
MIVDSDVLIWVSKGNPNAVRLIQECPGFQISAVTWMELMRGMRNKQELQWFKKALNQWEVEVIHITESISQQACIWVEQFCLSPSMEMADALIASTAKHYGLKLITGNSKHYSMILGNQVIPFLP